ncbi:MAG: T9SS type A sorting domain-containing protein [Bacteroidetes bacterium]|nr:T9SS type A sorting domain-containing protein [Bacteroidota bacterium]
MGIYITGNSIGGSYFYLNNGDSVQIANPDSLGGPYSYTSHCYIAKLDSLGNLLWRTVITHGKPFNITLDKSNNILLMADVGSNSLYFKSYSSQPIPNVDGNQKILLKIDNNGNLIWCSKISLNYSNSIQFSECNIDHSNNIYITGSYEYNSTFYSSNSPFSLSISSSSVGEKFYVVKYDSTGLVKWLVKGITSNIPNNGSAGTGIVVDSLGNSYVCGVTAISTNNSNNNFIVTDSYTSHTTNVGSFFLMKINTNGILNWITGMKKQSSTACYSPKLAIFNDRIGLIGKVHITGFTPWTGDIMSTNGDSMSITLNRGDAVVADYDTAGVLHDVYYISNSNIYSGIMPISLQMDNNNYYVLGHASMNINSSTFACLNDVIIPNGAYESLVAKMERVGCLPGVITNSNINSIQLKSISVFPNPNSGNEIEIISTISSGQIKIYDSLGGVVYSSSFNSPNFRLSCQNVLNSSGIYIIELISENDRVYSKLVVNK